MHSMHKFKYATLGEDGDGRHQIVLCETLAQARSAERRLASKWDDVYVFRIVGWSPAGRNRGEDALTFRHAGTLYEAQIENL